MSSTFHEPNASRFNGPPVQAPRGLIRPPDEVKAAVLKEQASRQPYYSDGYAKRVLDDMTLAYYYEGANVAYRSVPEGIEVLAVGDDEIDRFERNTPPEKRQDVRVEMP
jgi:hypothetical protein